MRALGILPFLFFCGLVIFLRSRRSFREAVIVAGVITGLWVVAGCELLSLFRAVAFWPLLMWWMIPTVFLAWKCRAWRPAIPELPRDQLLLGLVGATVLVLILIFIVAAATPPNNWDSLSAYLPRQVYWMQQRHVGLFPTNDVRMAIMPPCAEYTGLHLMILSGGDKWLNLIQSFALGLTALTASAIARELGCAARLQGLAALLVVTIPVATMEATNTKNNVVTAFFLCAFAFFGLKAYNSRQFSAPLIGSACGLLALSKGTGMMFGLPVAAWIGAACLRTAGLKRTLVWGTGVTLIALAINAGHFTRQITAFGSPFGYPTRNPNAVHTPRAFVSNLVRNTTMHLATGIKAIDQAQTRAVTGFHRFIGIGVNDRRTTYGASAPFAVVPKISDEDRAKAPVHAVLGITVFIVAVAALFRRRDRWITVFLLTPFVGFALLCFLLKWNEWNSRLHIPVFSLAAPISVFVLRRATLPFGAVALAVGLVCIMTNEAKPLSNLKRARLRFQDEEMRLGLQEAKRAVDQHRPRTVGIFARANRNEYFLLSTLLTGEKSPPLLVRMANRYPQIKSPHPEPDMVISWYRLPPAIETNLHSKYSLISEQGPVAIFLPKARP
jgi:hypothetical protein